MNLKLQFTKAIFFIQWLKYFKNDQYQYMCNNAFFRNFQSLYELVKK